MAGMAARLAAASIMSRIRAGVTTRHFRSTASKRKHAVSPASRTMATRRALSTRPRGALRRLPADPRSSPPPRHVRTLGKCRGHLANAAGLYQVSLLMTHSAFEHAGDIYSKYSKASSIGLFLGEIVR